MALKASDAKKVQIRKEVWNRLYDEDVLDNPTLPYKIIPIFKDIDAAVEKLLELDVVKNSEKILLSMEKVLRNPRCKILQTKGKMYATTYKSNLSTVCMVTAPENASMFKYKQCANLLQKSQIKSITEGEAVFDVLVVSSVAVSKTGQRACKDDTLGELEFCILSDLGYVTADTVVVTLVHDLQLVDDIPFTGDHHHLSVDYIVTPTQVIKCPKGQRSTDIVWSSLVPSQLEKLDVLRNIRYKQWKEGKDVRFKGEQDNPSEMEESTAVAERKRTRKVSYSDRKLEKKRTTSSSESKPHSKENGSKEGGRSNEPRKTSGFRGQRRYFRRQRRRVYSGRMSESDFKPAVYVGDLPKDMTSEAFSDLLAGKNVSPLNVVKREMVSHAFAIFETLDEVNDCLSRLEGLAIDDKQLKVELSRQTVRRQGHKEEAGDHAPNRHNGGLARGGVTAAGEM